MTRITSIGRSYAKFDFAFPIPILVDGKREAQGVC